MILCRALSYEENTLDKSRLSMDFGLVTSDGYFYYINVDNGNINKTIRVEERGNYMLAVRNNSDDTVSVVGYVNY